MTTVILPEDVVKLEVEIKRLTIENQQLRETLRDKFAMAALSGMISARPGFDQYRLEDGGLSVSDEEVEGYTMVMCKGAYAYADAMLAARK